jgi:signal transduction histidine kinase
MAPEAITSFKPIDLDFVQMLAQWIGSAMERVQFEENLLERDALLETMLRDIPVDFSVRDANLNMVIQSDLSKKYWGNNEGKPIDYSDIDKESKSKWQGIFKKALSGKATKGEDRVEIYGKPYTFYSIASPVKVKGKVSEVIVINIDISKLKETEQQLQEQNKQLTKLNTELDRFVYSASHDLRAPLASLLGLIDLTTRERNSDSTTHYLELMSKSINTMDRFIADITQYSRNLRFDTIANEIDFEDLFKESFEHVQYMLAGPATSSINIKGEFPFYSDHERLKIVFNNLISNSIRYKGYGRDTVIELNVTIDEEKAEIDVIDNGLGIGEEHLSRVFEMFYRANDKNVGSGLGLFIVKETIEKLKGTIIITSEVGVGTTVHIEIPNLSDEADANS